MECEKDQEQETLFWLIYRFANERNIIGLVELLLCTGNEYALSVNSISFAVDSSSPWAVGKEGFLY